MSDVEDNNSNVDAHEEEEEEVPAHPMVDDVPVVAEDENEPPEKPWERALQVQCGGGVFCTFLFSDPALPKWLHCLAADDIFHFSKALGIASAVETAGQDGRVAAPEGFDANRLLVAKSVSSSMYEVSFYQPPPELTDDAAPAAAPTEEAEGKDVGAASTADETLPEKPPVVSTIVFDVLTLAAIASPEVLSYCFSLPDVSTRYLSEWLAFTETGGEGSVARNLLAAQSEHPKRAVTLNFSWVFHKISLIPAVAASLVEVMVSLLRARYSPAEPVDASLIRNVPAVHALVSFLKHMPRGVLVKWTKPVPGNDDDAEVVAPFSSCLGLLALDIRRRETRRERGKRDLRDRVFETQKRFFPTKFRAGDDVVMANSFEHRAYVPVSLHLFQSDVAITVLALSTDDFSLASFEALLLQSVQSFGAGFYGSDWGLLHLLWLSTSHMSIEKIRALIQATPDEAFHANGIVDLEPWIASLQKQDTSQWAGPFAHKFWEVLNHNEGAMHKLESAAPSLHAAIKAVSASLANLKTDAASLTLEQFVRFESAVGRRNLLRDDVLLAVVEVGNVEVTKYLFKHGVKHVRPSLRHEPVDVLEHAVRGHLVSIVLALLEIGAQLGAPWEGGAGCGIQYVQDNYDAANAQLILELFSKLEAERSADPRRMCGVLAGTRAA